jgi:DNA-binding transcriptional LysR family regulator
MITKAEHQFQAELFERRAQGMVLTAAGSILAEQLRGVLTQLQDARVQIDELKGLRRGEVRVHCIEGVVLNVIPGAVASFNAKHPDVSFRINVASTDGIVEALQSDESDLGITFNMGRRPGIEVLFTFSQPLHVVAASDHPLSRKRKVTLADVVQYPITMPDRSFGVRAIFDRALEACGLECRMLVTTNSVALTRSAAQTGAAVTLTPPFAIGPELISGQVALVPVAEQKLLVGTASVCMRKGRHLPAAAAEFVRSLREKFEALALTAGNVHDPRKQARAANQRRGK